MYNNRIKIYYDRRRVITCKYINKSSFTRLYSHSTSLYIEIVTVNLEERIKGKIEEGRGVL
ncbi:hypothetical protein V1477_010906 [Vespula maculifrons]|uniref:Uncharacterized protein n=1 Tax=Vespula maculifrons TaxID=7453 RepID=A0ABD2C395_VESMC